MDDELKDFLEAMQRHLDRRLDDAEQRAIASEKRIRAEVKDGIQALETKLLSEFWKWARAAEARMRMFDAINAA